MSAPGSEFTRPGASLLALATRYLVREIRMRTVNFHYVISLSLKDGSLL